MKRLDAMVRNVAPPGWEFMPCPSCRHTRHKVLQRPGDVKVEIMGFRCARYKHEIILVTPATLPAAVGAR